MVVTQKYLVFEITWGFIQNSVLAFIFFEIFWNLQVGNMTVLHIRKLVGL